MGRTRGMRAVGRYVAIAGLGAAAALSHAADGSLQAGHGLLQRGLYDLAAREYEAALGEPESALAADEARYGLAVCAYRTGELETALGRLGEITGADGFTFGADAAVIRAHALFGLGRYADAGAAFAELADEHADHASAAPGVAMGVEAFHRAGDDRAAVRLADEHAAMVDDAPRRARMALFVGRSKERLGDLQGAAETLGPVAAADGAGGGGPVVDHARLRLATILHRLDRPDEALAWYERAAGAGTEAVRPGALLGVGTVRRAQGDARGALRALDELAEDFPDHEPVRRAYEAARARFDLGDYERARAQLDELAADGAGELEDDAAYWAAKASLRAGEAQDAAERLTRAVRAHGSSAFGAEMRYDLAVALERAGNKPEALAAFGEFRSEHAEHALVPDALLAEGSLALDLEDAEGALSRAEALLRGYADHAGAPVAGLVRGEALHRLGRFEDSVAQFAELADAETLSEGERDRAAYRLGLGLWRLGKHEDAAAALARVTDGVRTDPAFREALLALGDGAFAGRDWESAEEHLRAYLALKPAPEGAADAMLQLGLALARQDRHAEARDMFEALLDAEGSERHAAHAMFERGQAQVELGEDDAARESLEGAVELEGGERFEPFAARHLGAIALRAGDGGGAAAWFARAESSGRGVFTDAELLEIGTDRASALVAAGRARDAAEAAGSHEGWEASPRARAWRAVALSRAGEHEQAFEIAQGTDQGELDAELAALLGYERARSLRELGRADEARSAYRELLGTAADDRVRAHALTDLGTLQLDAGELGEGADTLERALTIEGIDDGLCRSALYQAAWARLELGEHARVAALMDADGRPCELAELTAPGELVYGEALLALGRAGDAADRLAIAAADADAPTHETALLRLGEARAQAQRWDASRAAFEEQLERYPESEDWFRARFGVGWALENSGEPEAALEHYRAVVDEHEGLMAVRAQFQVGECLFALERHEEAASELLRVDLLYEPTEWTAAALFEAGRCFEAMNKVGEARAEYRGVVERFGDTEWARRAGDRLARLSAGATPGRNGRGG